MKPQDVQILFADLQPPIVARSKTNPPEALKSSAGVLAKVADILAIPVVFTVVPDGGKAPELIPELAPYAAQSKPLPRMSATPFLDPATCDVLEQNHRKTLAIAGFATEVVTLHAALGALERGYHVQIVVDACGGLSGRTEDTAFRRMEAAGCILTSVVGLTTELAPDFSGPPGAKAFDALQTLRLA